MLYSIYDLQHAALTPFRMMAHAGHQLFSDPCLPVSDTAFGRAMAASFEMFERTTRRYDKPPFGLDAAEIDGTLTPIEEQIVLRHKFCELRRFARATERDDPKVLLIAPMSGHHATLLRGTVAAMMKEHDVYVTDWVDACRVPMSAGAFDLDDYIDLVIEFLRHLGPNTHVIAVCQPSVPALAAASLMAADNDSCRPASMTLMGGPIDTRINPTQVNLFAKNHSLAWFEKSVISRVPITYPGIGRRVYPGFLQLSGFMSMNLDRHLDAHMNMYQHLIEGDGDNAEAHRRFYDEYMSVMDLTAEFYLQTVERIFQEHQLATGAFESRGRKVDPAAIKDIALFTVEGELDDISAVGQTKAAHDLCTNLPAKLRRHYEQVKVGHYGIFNGRRWREEIQPQVRDFIRQHHRA